LAKTSVVNTRSSQTPFEQRTANKEKIKVGNQTDPKGRLAKQEVSKSDLTKQDVTKSFLLAETL
jgi:hypothetical protein